MLVVGARQEASRLKLVVNTWMSAATVAMADALDASDRLGIPTSMLLETLGDGPLAMPYALQKADPHDRRRLHPRVPGRSRPQGPPAGPAGQGTSATGPSQSRIGCSVTVNAGHARDDIAAVAAIG